MSVDSGLVVGFAGVAIGLSALIVSAWSVISSRRVGQEQTRIQERLLTLEGTRERDRLRAASSASLQAFVQRAGQSHRLVVRNSGASAARMIRTLMDGGPLLQHSLIPEGEEEVTVLAPTAEASYIMAVAMGKPSVVTIRLEWEDDTGTPGQWESQLKVI